MKRACPYCGKRHGDTARRSARQPAPVRRETAAERRARRAIPIAKGELHA